jgi:hypothetical protein
MTPAMPGAAWSSGPGDDDVARPRATGRNDRGRGLTRRGGDGMLGVINH